MSDSTTRWEEFLNPELLRGKLISASIYLAAYELLVDSIVERIKSFFTNGFNANGPQVSLKYKVEVLSRNTSLVYASLSWLQEQGAIDDKDVQAFEVIKKCRNEVAHEMPKIISGESEIQFIEQFPVMVSLLKKIEIWWIVNLEIPINPDFADADIDEAGIVPGPVWNLQLMIDVALGEPDKANYYLDEFKKQQIKQA